jgi:hypothetical protein
VGSSAGVDDDELCDDRSSGATADQLMADLGDHDTLGRQHTQRLRLRRR